MQKEIRYTGQTALPSDYECPDGELAYSLNLINEGEGLKRICVPAEVPGLDIREQPLLKHSVSGQDNWIVLDGKKDGAFHLAWLKDEPDNTAPREVEFIYFKEELSNLIDIAIIGNTLCLATDQGLQYILWKDGDYRHLGSRPPFVPITFGAYKVSEIGLVSNTKRKYTSVPKWSWANYSGHYSEANMPNYSKTDEDKAFWAGVSTRAMGLLLSNVSEAVTTKGYFYQPFFVRYAYRLYDGTHCWHSSPVLILPTTILPKIFIECNEVGTDGSNTDMWVKCILDVPYFGLAYRILGDPTALKDWSDIVVGIDFFISQPLYLFDQSKDMDYPMAEYMLYANHGVYTDDSTMHESSTTKCIFLGHYADTVTGPYKDRYENDFHPTNHMLNVCALSPNTSFLERIKNEFLFYRIASIDVDNIAHMTSMERLKLTKDDLTEINTLPTLDDEYNSHAKLYPTLLHSYNARLSVSGVSMSPPTPFYSCVYAEAANEGVLGGISTTNPPQTAKETVRVYSRINGVGCVAEYDMSFGEAYASHRGWYPFDANMPRFIYHPDASAYRMDVFQNGLKKASFELTPHAHLNGAYWFGGLSGKLFSIDSVGTTTTLPRRVEVTNKIYTSEVNNPFTFPVKGIVTVGCNNILGICSAAKALSQGQFGQFPLYAFTDNGVWALEVSATGSYSARQPITRDVVIGRNSITQIDSAVLFATRRGIMLLSGSQSQCITDTINTDYPFCCDVLPGIEKVFSSAGHLEPFLDFIAGCGILYDYTHQRIIVYNESQPYAYVFSMKSKQWAMIGSRIKYHISSYPEALAYTKDSTVVDFCLDGDNAETGMVVTRPVKLDLPDALKTIDTVIQRGDFRRGNVKSILYGSRDLINWHLVWSSKDHFLRGFHGTPYKYFRIVLLCDLGARESISGATVQFTPKLINRLR